LKTGFIVLRIVRLGKQGEGRYYIFLSSPEYAELAKDVILVEDVRSGPLLLALSDL
jgi:hypothetical protein